MKRLALLCFLGFGLTGIFYEIKSANPFINTLKYYRDHPLKVDTQLDILDMLNSKEKDQYIQERDSAFNTPLHIVATFPKQIENDAVSIAKKLLSLNARITSENKYNESPLDLAIDNRLSKLALYFINNHPNIEDTNMQQETPLDHVIKTSITINDVADLVYIASLLIKKGADLEKTLTYAQRLAEDTYRKLLIDFLKSQRPLFKQLDNFIQTHPTDTIALQDLNSLLININLNNVNEKNPLGDTPLLIIANFPPHLRKAAISIARKLLEIGADIHIKNVIDQSALDIAKKVSFNEFVELIQAHQTKNIMLLKNFDQDLRALAASH